MGNGLWNDLYLVYKLFAEDFISTIFFFILSVIRIWSESSFFLRDTDDYTHLYKSPPPFHPSTPSIRSLYRDDFILLPREFWNDEFHTRLLVVVFEGSFEQSLRLSSGKGLGVLVLNVKLFYGSTNLTCNFKLFVTGLCLRGHHREIMGVLVQVCGILESLLIRPRLRTDTEV